MIYTAFAFADCILIARVYNRVNIPDIAITQENILPGIASPYVITIL